MKHNYTILQWAGLIVLLSGCETLPDKYGLYQEPQPAWVIEQNNTRLQTVETLVQGGKSNTARLQADLINANELTAQQLAKSNLLYAQILLSFAEAEQAIAKMAHVDTGQLATGDRIKFYQSQAFAFALTGNALASTKARIALDPLLAKPNEKRKNQALILETLGMMPNIGEQNQDDKLKEWLVVAKILATRNQNPEQFKTALSNWQKANPDHPANLYLSGLPAGGSDKPPSIAILLPGSGPYADAGKAIKAGFMAAHSQDNTGTKPVLNFYDTEKTKPSELYQKAVKAGAKLVVGPLNKEHIQSLASSSELTVPVLALNHVPDLNKQNLYQFALSPMDDVAELTQKAALDGHKQAFLLVPNAEQSKRISSFFASSWQALGGQIVKKLSYDIKKDNLPAIVGQLLASVTSSTPPQNAARNPNDANAVATANPNTEALFLSAYSKEGRAINNQLQLQPSAKFTVYALPSIYSGTTNTVNDSALNNVVFCDMPWLFNSAYGGELSMAALRNIWSQFPETYVRLPAMGIDAYHLVSRLASIGTTPYSGATGKLSLASGNRIKRNLVCAKFVRGQPELIGFTHSPAEAP